MLHATVTGLSTNVATLSRPVPEAGITEPELPFDYLIYALGCHESEPIDLWGTQTLGSLSYDGTKARGVEWLKQAQQRIKQAPSVLVVGGGALGIRE